MSKAALLLVGAMLVLAGCSLAGDVTPPPAVATAQAVRPVSTDAATLQPQEPAISATPVVQERVLSLNLPNDQPDLINGERIYVEKCAGCHGPRGLGDSEMAAALDVPPPALGDPLIGRHATLFDWYAVVTEGRMERFMPPFSSLSDNERLDVAAYALALSISEEDLDRGERVYLEQCASCHGVEGVGVEGIPSLKDVSFATQRSVKDGFAVITQGMGQMPAFEEVLSEADRWAAARYIQTMSYYPVLEQMLVSEPSSSMGTIQGHVVNGTRGEIVPEGLEVTLVAIDAQTITFSTTTFVDEVGDFTFEDLEVQQGRIYLAYVDFQGVRYISESVHILDEQPVVNLSLIVYDSTSDTEKLRVERLHLIFNLISEELVEVTEVWVLSGPEDRTIVGADGVGLVEVSLPEEFGNLSFTDVADASSRYRLTDEGFRDLAPIQPGEPAELVFSFTLPFSRRLDFKQRMNYPVDAVVVLLPEGTSKIEADELQDLGVRDMGGIRMQNYAIDALTAGEDLELRFSSSGVLFGEPSALLNVLLGVSVLGVVLVGVGFWWVRREKGVVGEAIVNASHPNLQSLLQAIATLDDDFEAGRLSETEYRHRRETLKRKALTAMRGEDD